MSYDEALETAEKVLTHGASVEELLEMRDHLRALAPDSVLAARIEERIVALCRNGDQSSVEPHRAA